MLKINLRRAAVVVRDNDLQVLSLGDGVQAPLKVVGVVVVGDDSSVTIIHQLVVLGKKIK